MARLMLDLPHGTTLRYPDRAITDGSPAPRIVDAHILRQNLRTIRVSLPVDPRAQSRIRRFEAMRRISGLSAALVAVCAGVLMASAWDTSGWLPDARVLVVCLLLLLAAMSALVLGTLNLKPNYYPRLVHRRCILIEGIDASAAGDWAAINPAGVIRIVE